MTNNDVSIYFFFKQAFLLSLYNEFRIRMV